MKFTVSIVLDERALGPALAALQKAKDVHFDGLEINQLDEEPAPKKRASPKKQKVAKRTSPKKGPRGAVAAKVLDVLAKKKRITYTEAVNLIGRGAGSTFDRLLRQGRVKRVETGVYEYVAPKE